ncbi:hypothetical protein HNQ98_001830 [Leuconostoc carnosum]|nr:hypothetical protein [Leuconostoc carnosum]
MKASIIVLQQLQATLWQILAGLVLISLQNYIEDHNH